MFYSFAKNLVSVPAKNRKAELLKLLHAVEELTACRLGDLVKDSTKKHPSASLKLLQEFFGRCAARMTQHLDNLSADEKLEKILSCRITALKKIPTPGKKRTAEKSAEKLSSAASKKPKAAAAEKSKTCSSSSIPESVDDGDVNDEPKPESGGEPQKHPFQAATLQYDDEESVEVLSHGRLTARGKWKLQRATHENDYGTFNKIFLQKDRPFMDRVTKKERYYTVAFNQVNS